MWVEHLQRLDGGPRKPHLGGAIGDAVENVKEQRSANSCAAQGGVALAREVAQPDGNSQRGTHAYSRGVALAVADVGLPSGGPLDLDTRASSTRTRGLRTSRIASKVI